MKMKAPLFIGLGILCSVISLFLYCTLGEQPIGPNITDILDTIPDDSIVVWEDGTMEMYVTPSKVQASFTSTAEVIVRLYNKNHNPIAGKEVFFSSTHGLIETSAITDSSGLAEVTFTSEPVNAEASVYGWIFDYKKNKVMIRQTVTISGVELSLFTLKNVLKTTKVPVKIVASDAIGQPIAKKPVIFTGDIANTLITKGDGSVDTTVTRSDTGKIIINAACQGAFILDTIKFWDTIPGGVDTVQGIRTLRIFSSKSQLNADNTDNATITAILVDNQTNNPAIGDTVYFQSNYGIIDKSAVVDSTGRAHATLRSTPVNGVCYVYARAKGNVADTTTIIFSGVTLSLSAEPVNCPINEYSVITALITDASEKPIEGTKVDFNVQNGLFDNGINSISVIANSNGKAVARVTSASAGTAIIDGRALNCSDTANVAFTNNRLTITADPQVISIGGVAYSTLTATYRDGNNNLISGAWIRFYTNAGTLLNDSVITVNGEAINRLYSSYFANKATVQAVAANGTASTTVTFSSLHAASVDLKISPDNIGINGGVAVLTATVKDSSGNMVTGADVNFRIIQGPGGNEYIDKPVSTSKDGIARSQLFAGSLPSQYRACEVAAYVGLIADSTKMTISGAPYIVTVARPQSDTVIVSNVGQVDPATFKFNVGAVVQDVNGNNVADGMEVHFSAVVSGLAVARKRFVRWEVSATEIKPIITYSVMSVPFEDINNNFKMDKNIDLDLDDYPLIASRGDDWDGNGVMDYDIKLWDLFYDFNFNGKCDINECENCYQKAFIFKYDTLNKNNPTITNHSDTTINLYADNSTLFAGTSDSGIFLSNNNGDSWSAADKGLTKLNILSLIVSGKNIFAGGGTSGGELFLSTNNGRSWTPADNGLTNLKVQALAARGTNIFAGTSGGGVFLSTNNGKSWTPADSGLTNLDVLSLLVIGNNIFAGTSGGGVFLSTNNGTSWTPVNSGLTNLNVLALAVSGINIFAGTLGDGVFLSTNSGTSWTAAGLTGHSIQAFAVNGNNIIAGTSGSGVFLSTNNGTSWTAAGLTGHSIQAFAVSDNNIIAGTSSGSGVFRSKDNGTSWTAAGLTGHSIQAFAISGPNTYYDTLVKVIYDTTYNIIETKVDSSCTFFADLNNNGVWDKTELYVDNNGNDSCDMPPSRDFQYWRWEMRPQFHGVRFDFQENDFAVVIAASAVTKNGVAEASLVYPRQMALRLIVNINAEINGIRDRDGERFTLPVIIQGKK